MSQTTQQKTRRVVHCSFRRVVAWDMVYMFFGGLIGLGIAGAAFIG